MEIQAKGNNRENKQKKKTIPTWPPSYCKSKKAQLKELQFFTTEQIPGLTNNASFKLLTNLKQTLGFWGGVTCALGTWQGGPASTQAVLRPDQGHQLY